ncbi:hypothetical protein [Mesorhizobium sp. KR9-304]|uniref:hypothetical protein n=1 Tax=Mesorhizobium sp. KR9-304 TaxID=3156614 RepID=UPI0032B4E64A
MVPLRIDPDGALKGAPRTARTPVFLALGKVVPEQFEAGDTGCASGAVRFRDDQNAHGDSD